MDDLKDAVGAVILSELHPELDPTEDQQRYVNLVRDHLMASIRPHIAKVTENAVTKLQNQLDGARKRIGTLEHALNTEQAAIERVRRYADQIEPDYLDGYMGSGITEAIHEALDGES